MRFGICCSVENALHAVEAGFDYTEIPAASLKFCKAPLYVEAFNLVVPPNLNLYGDLAGSAVEVTKALALAPLWSVEVAVIGGGGQRRTHGKLPISVAEKQFSNLVLGWTQVYKRKGLAVAPEGLNHMETDVFTSCGHLARSMKIIDCAYTVDTYHCLVERGEAVDWVEEIPYVPAHVHFAGLNRDVVSLADKALLRAILRLREVGYDGRVSFEGTAEPSEYSKVLKQLRSIFLMA